MDWHVIQAAPGVLVALERGADTADPRLTRDWLIEAHRAQLSWARAEPAPG